MTPTPARRGRSPADTFSVAARRFLEQAVTAPDIDPALRPAAGAQHWRLKMRSEKEDGGPAYPVPGLQHDEDFNGMSLRQYAAIKLRIPESDTDWLDDMIRQSLRTDLAAKAMQGILSDTVSASKAMDANGAQPGKRPEILACVAYCMADSMLAARERS